MSTTIYHRQPTSIYSFSFRASSPNHLPVSSTPSPKSPLAHAPGDLLLEIAAHLPCRNDLYSFSLTSRHIYAHLSQILYAKVVLTTLEQCQVTLEMLYQRPDIARHVRHLSVNPRSNRKLAFPYLGNDIVSSAVRKVASGMRLDALLTFEWQGQDSPHNDDMWFALRMGCPQLRYISTTFGGLVPGVYSHLFDFKDLLGFSLTLTSGFYERHLDLFLEDENSTSRKLWDMLLTQCPNLQQLCILGSSSVPIDAHVLMEGRWPKLRTLSLGDVSVDWVPGHIPSATRKRPFIEFLEAHPHIGSLSLSKHTVQPNQLHTLDTSIHQLTSFTGTLAQLQAIPHVHASLKSLSIQDPIMTRETSALAVAGILQGISALEELKISFTLHSMYDSGSLLRSLTNACPNLRHLDLTCAHKPSFQLESFSRNIRSLSKLRSLRLTIVRYPGDEALSSGAARIAKANPRISHFTLTVLPPTYPLPLPFSLPSFPFSFFPSSSSSGRFILTTDTHGLPVSLKALEHSGLKWPWGLGETNKTKKYVEDLRPMGLPGRRQGGVGGLLGLVTERSAAGDEMRVILFCVMMVVLAVWGIWRKD